MHARARVQRTRLVEDVYCRVSRGSERLPKSAWLPSGAGSERNHGHHVIRVSRKRQGSSAGAAVRRSPGWVVGCSVGTPLHPCHVIPGDPVS